MKQRFVGKKFSQDAEALLTVINEILDTYEAQGYDLSLRQLYYQLVSRNVVPNTEKSYTRIGTLVSDARLAGRIDWNMIADRGRRCVQNLHWTGADDFLRSVAPQFRMNLWTGQTRYVEVMVEKQALEGVLIPVCRTWDVPFTANKGYTSSSALYQAGQRFAMKAMEGRGLHLLYMGDHDPSGIDMGRDIEDRLNLFVRAMVEQVEGVDLGPSLVRVHRVALNMDQVRALRPPENPAKLTDSRAEGYVEKFGYSSWELDAIEPRELSRLLSEAIQNLMSVALFKTMERTQEKTREFLLRLTNGDDDEVDDG